MLNPPNEPGRLTRRDVLRGAAAASVAGAPHLLAHACADDSHFSGGAAASVAHAQELLIDGFWTRAAPFFEWYRDFKVFVDPTFTPEQKQVIRNAMEWHFRIGVHMKHLADQAAAACRWGAPQGGTNGRTRWQWYNALYGRQLVYQCVAQDDPADKRPALDSEGRPAVVDGRQMFVVRDPVLADERDHKPSVLHISRVWDLPKTKGGYDTWGLGWPDVIREEDPVYVFSIGLNSDLMHPGYAGNPWVWSSVIIHECLHNLGYRHPNNAEDARYDGHFINVFENLYKSRAPQSDVKSGDALGARPFRRLVGCH